MSTVNMASTNLEAGDVWMLHCRGPPDLESPGKVAGLLTLEQYFSGALLGLHQHMDVS